MHTTKNVEVSYAKKKKRKETMRYFQILNKINKRNIQKEKLKNPKEKPKYTKTNEAPRTFHSIYTRWHNDA